jgi:hypothetical protein
MSWQSTTKHPICHITGDLFAFLFRRRISIKFFKFTTKYGDVLVIAKADSKYRSMKEVIADAKANPTKVTIGGAQVGSADSICTYLTN